MRKVCHEVLQSLEEKIKDLEFETNGTLSLAEYAIESTIESLKNLKKEVLGRGFKSEDDEIYFFK